MREGLKETLTVVRLGLIQCPATNATPRLKLDLVDQSLALQTTGDDRLEHINQEPATGNFNSERDKPPT